MKRYFIMSMLMAVLGASVFTSCSSIEEAQPTVAERISADAGFTLALNSTVDVVVAATENQWLANSGAIQELVRKAEGRDLTAAETAQLESLIGMDLAAYTRLMTDFGNAWNGLLEKYPALADMSAAERQAIFAEAVGNNEVLLAHLAEVQEMMRACLWQDLCGLVVNIAELVGGPLLCDLIANAVPIIGPLLCNIVLDIAKDLLMGICALLPC